MRPCRRLAAAPSQSSSRHRDEASVDVTFRTRAAAAAGSISSARNSSNGLYGHVAVAADAHAAAAREPTGELEDAVAQVRLRRGAESRMRIARREPRASPSA
jgi:hypothetical protein